MKRSCRAYHTHHLQKRVCLLQVFCASLQTKTGTIVYDKNIVGPGFEDEHQHEEADTLIPYRVLVADSEYPGRQICVSSPDTDVFIL